MKRFTVWSGFLGVLLSYTVAVGCSSDDSGSGGSASGGDTSSGGKKSSGGSDSGGSDGSGANSGSGGKKSTGGSGGSDSTGGMGGEAMGGLGGMGGDAGTDPENYLENPGFEEGSTDKLAPIPGWEEEGDLVASYLEANEARTGVKKLGHWMEWENDGDKFEVSTYQTVTSIPNGTYTFSVWVHRSEGFEAQYLFARDYGDGANEMTQDTIDNFSEAEYVKVELSGIEVTNNQVTVGIYSSADAGVWANFDDAALVQE